MRGEQPSEFEVASLVAAVTVVAVAIVTGLVISLYDPIATCARPALQFQRIAIAQIRCRFGKQVEHSCSGKIGARKILAQWDLKLHFSAARVR